MSCLFCDIAEKKIPAKVIFENDELVAFRDIDPKAPTHVLIIPRKHVSSINDLDESEAALIGNLTLAAKQIAHKEGIAKSGYRLVMNCNNDGGQTVYHIHMHLLGGRWMGWPPG
jgi:histidine triad (HIT) family protein